MAAAAAQRMAAPPAPQPKVFHLLFFVALFCNENRWGRRENCNFISFFLHQFSGVLFQPPEKPPVTTVFVGNINEKCGNELIRAILTVECFIIMLSL